VKQPDSPSTENPTRVAASLRRRDVLKLAAGGAFAAGASSSLARPQAKTAKKIVVAGAGISGLCCAYELMKRGHEVTVLEAAGRSGGHLLTVRDRLADGLYADAGAEHFYRSAYGELYRYIEEFDLPTLPYHRRDSMVRFLRGSPYTEQMLADREVLGKLGLNQREVEFVARHSWPDLSMLYLGPYLDSFPDERRPFDAGLNDLDRITMSDLLQKDGASPAVIEFTGGSSSALHTLWFDAVKKIRGIPQYEKTVFRIEGGNQRIADAFASRLAARLRLGCPLTAIEHGDSGVTARYEEFGQAKAIAADHVVLCMSFRELRRIPVTPGWPEAKQYVIDNMNYELKARVVFQSRTPFWETDGVSPNIEFSQRELTDVWRTSEDIRSSRGLLIGQARTSEAANALAKFRELYPGKSEDIEQALLFNWAEDPWSGSCLPVRRPPGELARFWPEVSRPHGRIHFASVCVDCFPNGLEGGIRAGQQAAKKIAEG
jgi:monoamine oxidase